MQVKKIHPQYNINHRTTLQHKQDSRYIYKRINNLRRDFKKKEIFLKDDNEFLIISDKEIAKKKKLEKYFTELFNCKEPEEMYLIFTFNLGNTI